MYYCRNCLYPIKIGVYNCPFCRWFNFGAGTEQSEKIAIQQALIFIAIKRAKVIKPKTVYISLYKLRDTIYRIIGRSDNSIILTMITDYKKEG